MSAPQPLEFGSIEALVEVSLSKPPARVWQALVDEAGSWWRPDFFQGAAKDFQIEARPGGRVFEDWGDGHGALWYTVTHADPGKLLALSGELAPEFGGPARVLTRFELEPDGDGTRVRLREYAFGRVDEKLGQSLEEGWRLLLEDGLKPWIEEARPASAAV